MERPTPTINHTVVITDPAEYSVIELNKYSHADVQPDKDLAWIENEMFKLALENAGIEPIQVPSPSGEACQDAIYTANWALCDGDMAVMANLPFPRRGERAHAQQVFGNETLLALNKKTRIIELPEQWRFSGQGDALFCDDTLLVGSGYRTSPEVVGFLRDQFQGKYNVVGVNTIPLLDASGRPQINKESGWEDSEFYDIDLAVGVVAPRKIIWCPEAFKPESQDKINDLGFETIEISKDEATETFVCNGVGNGIDTYIVGKQPPEGVIRGLAAWGISACVVDIPELHKGGGSTRCMSNTIRHRA